MAANNSKRPRTVDPHPKGKGREHVEQSHNLKKILSKSPTVQKHFSHSAMGNR